MSSMLQYYAAVAKQKPIDAPSHAPFEPDDLAQDYLPDPADLQDYGEAAETAETADSWFEQSQPVYMEEFEPVMFPVPVENEEGTESEVVIMKSVDMEDSPAAQTSLPAGPPPKGFGAPGAQQVQSRTLGHSRYLVPEQMAVADGFSSGSSQILQQSDSDEEEDENTPVFPQEFEEFDYPDSDDEDEDEDGTREIDLEPLECESFTMVNPVPLPGAEVGVVVQWEKRLKEVGTKDKKEQDRLLKEKMEKRREQIDVVHAKLTKPIKRKYRNLTRSFLSELEEEYHVAIGHELAEDKAKEKEEKRNAKLAALAALERSELATVEKEYLTSLSRLTKAVNARLKYEDSRVNRAVAAGMLQLQWVKNENRRRGQKAKMQRNVKQLKSFWAPYEKRYLEWEPKWLTPVRRVPFSYDEKTGTHRLLLAYRWMNSVRMVGFFVLFISFLYATGYIDKWFVTPFNMFDQPRREYLDAEGRLIPGALTVFGLMEKDVHDRQVDWLVQSDFQTEMSLFDLQQGYVTTLWTDGKEINVPTTLIDRRLRAEAKRTRKTCICGAHMGLPLNVVFLKSKDVVMFEPHFSTQSKAKLQVRPRDLFQSAFPETVYPKSATVQFFALDSGATVRARRLAVEKEQNMCIVRCGQVLGKKTS